MPNNFISQSQLTSGFVVDANTKLLMRFEGGQGSTVFTDDVGHVVTNHGVPFMDNGVVMDGVSSGYFDGGSYLTIPNTDFTFAGDFTIEFMFQLITFPSSSRMIIGTYTANAQGHWMFEIVGATSPVWYINGAGVFASASVTWSLNTTYKVALVRSGSTCTMYVNGVALGTTGSYSGTFGAAGLNLAIAANPAGGSLANCRVDQLRISNIARYTGNYTPL